MATLGSRDFQIGYQKLTEVTRVEARGKYLGTWYPAGAEPFEEAPVTTDVVMGYRTEIEALQAEVRELKRLLASRGAPAAPISDPSFGRSYPAPKTGKK